MKDCAVKTSVQEPACLNAKKKQIYQAGHQAAVGKAKP